MSVTREFLQPTKETPVKPSLLIVTNAKDNEIIDLIYDHALLIRSPSGHIIKPVCSKLAGYGEIT